MAAKSILRLSIFFLLGIGLLALFLHFGFQNQKDPLWEKLDTFFQEDIKTLAKSEDSLQLLFDQFHGTPPLQTKAIDLLAQPFLPDMTFEKFRQHFELLKNQQFIIFSGVTGSGTSTLTERLAQYIAIDRKRILEINCAPQFDLEYNKKYIGQFDNRRLQKGELLQFFDQCMAAPKDKFVVIIDNFDKINPETFFGPDIWKKLDDKSQELVMGETVIQIPENLYVISVTHAGVGSKIELNNEHFKRLGGQYFIRPNVTELLLYLRSKRAECKSSDQSPGCSLLLDDQHLKSFIYFFLKTNELIENRFSNGHTLGQWSNIRKAYKDREFAEAQKIFLNHVNAFKNKTPLRERDFHPIFYTIQTDGYLKNSNFIKRQIQFLEEKGFLTEFIVGLSFLLITALVSFFFFRRRQKVIRTYIQAVHQLVDRYDQGKMDYDAINQQIKNIKKEVDELIMNNQLNYNEATFFYTFIKDRTHRIELAHNVGLNFRELMNSFLDDGVLSEKEHQKLLQYLESIRTKISQEDYEGFRQEVNLTYRRYRGNH